MNNTWKFITVCLVYYHHYLFIPTGGTRFVMIMIGEQTVADSPLISWLLNYWSGMYMVTNNSFTLSQLYSTHAIRRETCIVRGFISSVMITWIPKIFLDNVVILPPDMN